MVSAARLTAIDIAPGSLSSCDVDRQEKSESAIVGLIRLQPLYSEA
jgi:hypothetical protein